MKNTAGKNSSRIGINNCKVIIVVVLMVLLSSVRGNAQMTAKQIDSIVNKAINSMDNAVGFAIGIVKDGKIVHVKGYGIRSGDSKETVTAHTPFGIASNSKAFTSAALAILRTKRPLPGALSMKFWSRSL